MTSEAAVLFERLKSGSPSDVALPGDVERFADSDAPERFEVLAGASKFRCEPLEDDDNLGVDVRLTAVRGLSRIEDDRAVGLLLELMLESTEDEIGRAAAWALGERQDPVAVAALVRVMHSGDPGGRWEQAMYSLARYDLLELDTQINGLGHFRHERAPQLAPLPSGAEIRRLALWNNEYSGSG